MNRPLVLLAGCTGELASAFVRLYSEQLHIVGVARRDPRWSKPHSAEFIAADLAVDPESVVAEVLRRHGRLDWIVFNAVDYQLRPLPETAWRAFGDQLRLNVAAPLGLINAALSGYWQAQPRTENHTLHRGACLISSISGHKAFRGRSQGAYAASKAALNMLTVHLGFELAPFGLRVNALAPAAFPRRVPTERVCEALLELRTTPLSGDVHVLTPERLYALPQHVG